MPLDQDSDLFSLVLLEREAVDFTKADHVQVLLQSCVVLLHHVGSVLLVPSDEHDVFIMMAKDVAVKTGVKEIMVQDYEGDIHFIPGKGAN